MISSIYHSPTQLLTYARFFCFSFHFPSMLRVSSNDLKPRYPSISSILRQILSTLYSIGELHGRRKSGSRCVFDRILSPSLVEQNSTITWLPGEDSKMLPARARPRRERACFHVVGADGWRARAARTHAISPFIRATHTNSPRIAREP